MGSTAKKSGQRPQVTVTLRESDLQELLQLNRVENYDVASGAGPIEIVGDVPLELGYGPMDVFGAVDDLGALLAPCTLVVYPQLDELLAHAVVATLPVLLHGDDAQPGWWGILCLEVLGYDLDEHGGGELENVDGFVYLVTQQRQHPSEVLAVEGR